MSFKHHMSGISLSTSHALSHLILKTIVQSRCLIVTIILILQLRKRGLRYRRGRVLQPKPYCWQVMESEYRPRESDFRSKFTNHQRTKLKLMSEIQEEDDSVIIGFSFSQTCFYCFHVLHRNGYLIVSSFMPIPDYQIRESVQPRQRQSSISVKVRSGFQKKRNRACHLE